MSTPFRLDDLLAPEKPQAFRLDDLLAPEPVAEPVRPSPVGSAFHLGIGRMVAPTLAREFGAPETVAPEVPTLPVRRATTAFDLGVGRGQPTLTAEIGAPEPTWPAVRRPDVARDVLAPQGFSAAQAEALANAPEPVRTGRLPTIAERLGEQTHEGRPRRLGDPRSAVPEGRPDLLPYADTVIPRREAAAIDAPILEADRRESLDAQQSLPGQVLASGRRGFTAGALQAKAALGETARMVGQAGFAIPAFAGGVQVPVPGAAIEDWGRGVSAAAREASGRVPGPRKTLEELGQNFNLADAVDWAAWNIGQGLASSATSMVGGVAGFAVGGPVGAFVGAAAPSFFLNQQDVRQAVLDEGGDEATADRVSALAAGPMAALDAITPASIISRFNREARQEVARSLVRRVLAGMAKGAATEAPTETAQNVIGALATAKTFDRPVSREEWQQALEGGVAGALTGGVLGGAGGIAGGRRRGPDGGAPTSPRPVPEPARPAPIAPEPVVAAPEPARPVLEPSAAPVGRVPDVAPVARPPLTAEEVPSFITPPSGEVWAPVPGRPGIEQLVPTAAEQADGTVMPTREATPAEPPSPYKTLNELTPEERQAVGVPDAVPAEPFKLDDLLGDGPREYVSESQPHRPATAEDVHVRNVARALKDAGPAAIAEAAAEMAPRIPDGAHLWPVPNSQGSDVANAALAEAIAEIRPDVTVRGGVARDGPVESSRARRQQRKPGLTADEQAASFRASQAADLDAPNVIIDNVEVTGATAAGIRTAIGDPNAKLVTYARAPVPAFEGEAPSVSGDEFDQVVVRRPTAPTGRGVLPDDKPNLADPQVAAAARAFAKRPAGQPAISAEEAGVAVPEAGVVPAATEPQAPPPQAATGPSAQFPPAAGVYDVPPSAMNYDPDTYQFKQVGAGARGQSLADVEKWDKTREGVTLLWQNPERGTVDIVNGHNRYQAAVRLGVPALPSRFIDVKTPQEARAVGALANIAENRGDALDVAKVFRDMGATPETLRVQGLSLREGLVDAGLALARLSPDLFDRVARGEIPQREAIAVGSMLDDPAMQRAALKAVEGRGKSEAAVLEVARQVRDAGTEDVGQETLFGAEADRHALFVERGDIAVAIKKKLGRDRFMAKYLTGAAEDIASRGLGAVNAEVAQAQAEEGGLVGEMFTRLYTRTGPVADVVTEGARRVARGEKPAAVAADIYPAVRDAVARELDAARPGAARGAEVATVGAPEAAGSQEFPPPFVDPDQAGMFGVSEKTTPYGETVTQGNLFGAAETTGPVGTRDLFPEDRPATPASATAEAKATVQRKLKPEEVKGERLGLTTGEVEPRDLPGERPLTLLEKGAPYGIAEVGPLYHGSPHRFDRFDASKIGSGQGGQQFGYGLYFAEDPSVGKHYRDQLTSGKSRTFHALGADSREVPDWIGNSITRLIDEGDVAGAQELIDTRIADFKKWAAEERAAAAQPGAMQPWLAEDRANKQERVAQALQKLRDAGDFGSTPAGGFYEVKVDADPEDFLALDRPINEQSPKVKGALKKLGFNPEVAPNYPTLAQAARLFKSPRVARLAREDIGTRESIRDGLRLVEAKDEAGFRRWFAESGRTLAPGRVPDGHMMGRDLYEELRFALHEPTPEAASKALNRAGIKGLRYRVPSAGEGPTHNYVVFNDADIKITAVQEAAAQIDLVFGSAKAGETAARMGLDANRVQTFDERRQVIPTGKKTYVDVRGKRLSDAQDTAMVARPFRSPQAETLQALLLDDKGVILSREAVSSGAINYVDLDLPRDNVAIAKAEQRGDLPRWLAKLAMRAEKVGATRLEWVHNHPSGNATPSLGDLKFTLETARLFAATRVGVKLKVKHTVTDYDTVTVILPETETGGVLKREEQITPPMPDGPDWLVDRGPRVSTAATAAQVVGHVADNEIHAIYRDNSGRAVALVPHRASAAATVGTWIRQEAAALGAVDAILVVPSTDIELWRRLTVNAPGEVRDVIGLDPVSGVYDSAQRRGLVGQEQFGNEPGRRARHVVGEDEPAPYGERPVPAGRGEGALRGEGAGEAPVAKTAQQWVDEVVSEPGWLDKTDQEIRNEARRRAQAPPLPEAVAAPEALKPDDTVSLKKADAADIRARLGLDELAAPMRQSFQMAWDEATREKLADSILGLARLYPPRALTSVEHAAAVQRLLQIERDLTASDKTLAEAAQRNEQVIVDRETGRGLQMLEEIDQLTRLTDRAGTEAGRNLSIRRLRANRDTFDLATGIRYARTRKGSALNPEDLQRVKEATTRVKELEDQNATLRGANDALTAQRDRALAASVTEIVRRRRQPQGVAKILDERTKILKALEALGARLNDFVGASLESSYLIGKLAVSHIHEQVAAGAERVALDRVVESVLADLNNPSITAPDIYRALATQHPKEQVRAQSAAQRQVHDLKTQARLLLEIEKAEAGILAAKKAPGAATEEVRVLQKRLAALRVLAYQTARDGAKLEHAIQTINALEEHLEQRTRPVRKAAPETPPDLAELQTKIRGLRQEMRTEDALSDLQEQLRTGVFKMPVPRTSGYTSPALERNQIALARARRDWRAVIESMQPMTAGKVANRIASELRTLQATADLSATLRQGLIPSVRHPVIAARAFEGQVRAFFSEHSADQIDNAIRQSPMQLLRDRAKLALTDTGNQLTHREEYFASHLAERIPVYGALVRGSDRAMSTDLNLIRTAVFDWFANKYPNATDAELAAWADWVNVTTGRGSMGRLAAAGNALSTVFFAPRFAVSRFQAPTMLFKYWKEPRVRKEIAKDYAAFLGVGMTALALAALAGATVGLDPRNSDFGKIRIGDTRIDIWGGMLQPFRLLARLVLGATDRVGVTGQDLPASKKALDPLALLGQFASFKLSPMVTVPVELYRGRDVIGQPQTPTQTALSTVMPMVVGDAVDAYRSQGVGGALAFGGLSFLGAASSTYAAKPPRQSGGTSPFVRPGGGTGSRPPWR
jgi:hypothetical protein